MNMFGMFGDGQPNKFCKECLNDRGQIGVIIPVREEPQETRPSKGIFPTEVVPKPAGAKKRYECTVCEKTFAGGEYYDRFHLLLIIFAAVTEINPDVIKEMATELGGILEQQTEQAEAKEEEYQERLKRGEVSKEERARHTVESLLGGIFTD
jgi:CRISPR/Cas system-associated protein Cas10 (large subunit of type III CRISPR-Cas system)